MFKLTLFVLCLAVMALGGGFTGLAMALGALTFVIGAGALLLSAWTVLSR